MKRAHGQAVGKKLLVASLLGFAVVLALAFSSSKPKVYSVPVAEFLKSGPADETVRVRGMLVHGTLCKITAECGYRFRLQDSGQQLSVAYDECIIPDTFRDVPGMDIEITAEGERCQGCHELEATQIVVKCPAKYEMNGFPSRPAAPIPLCKSLLRKPAT
jgi:cytochrome c-type biogenesis protein CcmE